MLYKYKPEAKDVSPNINRTQAAERAENAVLSPVTLTFDLQTRPIARDQTRLPCEFGANPFSVSRDISYTNKEPQTDGAKLRIFAIHCRSLRAVINANAKVTVNVN